MQKYTVKLAGFGADEVDEVAAELIGLIEARTGRQACYRVDGDVLTITIL